MVELVSLKFQGPIAILQLAGGEEKIAILNAERMRQFEACLTQIRANKDVKGLVIIGNRSGFCAGADITAIGGITDPMEGERLAKEGQRLFQLVENLTIPSVAAVSGACAGGGCELTLACTRRIISGAESSKIGLPEVRLGIIPGFGGTQRLPRLIGFPQAAQLILKGRLLGAVEALKNGLVDEVVPDGPNAFSELEAKAVALAQSLASQGITSASVRPLPIGKRLMTYNAPVRGFVVKRMRALVGKETGGFYPAPPRAIDSMLCGLTEGTERGYAFEAKVLGELIASKECKSLVHMFHASESAQKIGKTKKEEASGLSTAVVGAGIMGSGIAAVLASKGYKVCVVDSAEQALNTSKQRIRSILDSNKRLSESKREKIFSSIAFESSLEKTKSADLIIEAIIEDMAGKKKLLQGIAAVAGKSTILGSNTSSLSISELGEGIPGPERFIGMHFFNPAEKMPLVEIVRGKGTDERALLVTAAVAAAVGKYPIIVEDGAGFLVNRILTPYLAEAGVLLSEGFSVEQIDRAAKDFGMPMGPLRLLDEVGLDVAARVAEIMKDAYGESFSSPNHAATLLKMGRKGKKTGSGFYVYQGGGEHVDATLQSALSLPSVPKSDAGDICDRLILRMVNEAVRCLQSGVAGRPGQEAANQIDLGAVMGCGFPPFRGGVLHYAFDRGLPVVIQRLEQLAGKYGERFLPCDELRVLAS